MAEKAKDVKDRASAAGWTAAHYTTEKAVEGTKATGRAVGGVAGYVGEKATAAGQAIADMAKKPLGAARDAVVSTGESAKEYTGRKEEEAHRALESKKTTETDHRQDQQQKEEETAETVVQGGGEGGGGGGVLGAIGETLAEIAQNTAYMVAGSPEDSSGVGMKGKNLVGKNE